MRALLAEAHKDHGIGADCLASFLAGHCEDDESFVRSTVGGVLVAETLHEMKLTRKAIETLIRVTAKVHGGGST